MATLRTADFLGVYLIESMSVKCMTMHGDRSQQQREYALSLFHKGETPILIATDVCARGIDIRNVGVVVNYDAPSQTEDYVHR